MAHKIFLVLFFLAATSAFAASDMPLEYRADPAAVIASSAAATAARFPDADAMTLDDRIHTRYEPDGSDVTWDDEWIKVLTEKGRRAHASCSLAFSARYGDAEIQLVEIVGTNGVVRPVDFARTLKIATDNSSTASNIVDPMNKKCVCAVPGLSVGEIRHVVVRRRTCKSRMKNTWADVNLLEYSAPIASTVITVDQPDALPVVAVQLRHPNAETVVRAPDLALGKGRTLLKWTARDVPQAIPEPNMPPLSDCVQALHLSTARDWPTVSRWYWQLCRPHLEATSPALSNQVEAIVAPCQDDASRIRALFKFVSQEVRYMGLTLEDDAPGYEPHDVFLTFAKRYGVCRDKAALLVAMLRVAGYNACPVLINAGAKKNPDVPQPYFNHAIVAVETPAAVGRRDGKWSLMDPTDESARDIFPSYLSDCSYLVATPAGEALGTTPIVPASANGLHARTTASLSADGSALVTCSLAFDGATDSIFRHPLRGKTPKERRELFERIYRSSAPGAELLDFKLEPDDPADTERRLSCRFTAKVPQLVLRGKTRDALPPPLFTRAFDLVDWLGGFTTLERRRFPLRFDTTIAADETLELELGDSVGAALDLPPNLTLGEGTGCVYRREVKTERGRIRVHRTLELATLEFAPAAYDALREQLKEIERVERPDFEFVARENVDAHVRTRLMDSIVHLASPRRWTMTNTVEKEVLTYRGKKSCAELEYSFTPCARTVELVSAVVSNRDGRVFAVTPKEINLLDASRTASAPRYPPGKVLMVNLPGVEIGSVIRYVVATTVTNAPLDYCLFNNFDSTEPVDRDRLELHVSPGVELRLSSYPRQPACRRTSGPDGEVYVWDVSNPERVPDEPLQPAASRWRRSLFVTTANWESFDRELAAALERARELGSDAARRTAREVADGADTPSAKIRAVRTWLARHVRAAGPGLFAVPFDLAFFSPDRVIADGYASVADRRNLLRTMLEELGFDCSFALAAGDAADDRDITRVYEELPRPNYFDELLVKAVWREGWMPGFREERVFWLGGENEYAPPETCANAGDTVREIERGEFGEIPVDEWRSRQECRCRMSVRENGAVDVDVTNLTWGAEVGTLRKRYAEMLPEMRSRHHRKLLGNLAQNAEATSELQTEMEGYPVSVAYSAYVEGMAVVNGDVLTVKVPGLGAELPRVERGERKSPIAIPGCDESVDRIEIVFPRGYGFVERMPESYTLANPNRRDETWSVGEMSTREEEGRLVVSLVRRTRRLHMELLGADLNAYLVEWNRRLAAESANTVTVRRLR